MTDPRPGPGAEKGDFLRIKQGLDPKASYIIFEHHVRFRNDSIFNPSNPAYGFLETQGLSWRQVADPDLSMEYLVIRVPPGDEEKILGRILGYGFPETIVFYIFKAEEV